MSHYNVVLYKVLVFQMTPCLHVKNDLET